jgi:ABC-type multidrug transport system ATPase subunit
MRIGGFLEAFEMGLLRVKDVHKRFGHLEVLKGVNLKIDSGEIVGITGENGSGKTTLLRIIAGMLRSDRGKVEIRGSFGYCPQTPLVFENLTMEENIAYFSAAYGLNEEEGISRGKNLMEELRCGQYAKMLAAHLSGGTLQKLNLIVSLLHNPDLLILDEPYQGFDYESYLNFWKLAKKLKGDGKSVMLVSHMVYEHSLFTTVYQLKQGRLTRERTK